MDAFRTALDDWLTRTKTSQAELSRRSGVPQNVISRWLGTDPTRPSDTNLRKLAPIIGIDYEDLLCMCGYLPGQPKLTRNPELAALLSRIEAGWLAMDAAERPIAERTALALFHVPPVQRPTIGRRRRATIRPEAPARQIERFDGDDGENGPEAPIAKRYELPERAFPWSLGRIVAPIRIPA